MGIIESISNVLDGGRKRGEKQEKETKANIKKLDKEAREYDEKKAAESKGIEEKEAAKRQEELKQEKIAREYLKLSERIMKLEKEEERLQNAISAQPREAWRNYDTHQENRRAEVRASKKEKDEVVKELIELEGQRVELKLQLTEESLKKFVEPVEEQRKHLVAVEVPKREPGEGLVAARVPEPKSNLRSEKLTEPKSNLRAERLTEQKK